MGIGRASGENRAEDAAKQAIQSPLLETTIEGARGVIISITGSESLGLHEVNTAAELVQRSVDPEANIIFGSVIDKSLDEDIVITVIATGFDKEPGTLETSSIKQSPAQPWAKKPVPPVQPSTNNGPDLDLPPFLLKNKNLNK